MALFYFLGSAVTIGYIHTSEDLVITWFFFQVWVSSLIMLFLGFHPFIRKNHYFISIYTLLHIYHIFLVKGHLCCLHFVVDISIVAKGMFDLVSMGKVVASLGISKGGIDQSKIDTLLDFCEFFILIPIMPAEVCNPRTINKSSPLPQILVCISFGLIWCTSTFLLEFQSLIS